MKKLPLLALALAMPAVGSAKSAPTYRLTASIPVAEEGGWDYARVDSAAHRLYVARATTVSVVDTATGKPLAPIGTLARGHAVVPLGNDRLLVTSGNDASVRFLTTDGRELARVAVGKKPDAAILSADGRTVYVMNADDGTVSVLDVAAMRVTRTITVKPALEYAALAADGTLFVNDEDANEIEVVDAARGTAATPIALPGCDAPSGLALDARTSRLIAACANGKAAVVDARTRRLVGLVDVGLGPDAVILDAARRRAFVPCGKDGMLDVLSLDGPAVRRVARVRTAVGARTGALDPASGTVYLPTASLMSSVTPGGRPVPRPGSFRILVVKAG